MGDTFRGYERGFSASKALAASTLDLSLPSSVSLCAVERLAEVPEMDGKMVEKFFICPHPRT